MIGVRDDALRVDPADVRSVWHWPQRSAGHKAADISVLIPCYRAELHIDGALTSIENQIGVPPDVRLQVVVVVDGRPDDAAAVRQSIARRVHPLRFTLVLVELSRNLGAGLARCHGWTYCSGDLVAFLDDDDVWYPHKLALQYDLHRRHPDRIASGHLYGPLPVPDTDAASVPVMPDVKSVGFSSLLTRSSLATPTLMIRRSLWPDGPEPYRFGEDTLMKLMIASVHPILELQRVLAGPSPDALPTLIDDHSLTRQRWPSRRAQWRNYLLLVRCGRLSPWRLPGLMALSVALLVRRLMIDAIEKGIGKNRS